MFTNTIYTWTPKFLFIILYILNNPLKVLSNFRFDWRWLEINLEATSYVLRLAIWKCYILALSNTKCKKKVFCLSREPNKVNQSHSQKGDFHLSLLTAKRQPTLLSCTWSKHKSRFLYCTPSSLYSAETEYSGHSLENGKHWIHGYFICL